MNKPLLISLILASPFIMNDREPPAGYVIPFGSDLMSQLALNAFPQDEKNDFGDAPISYGSAYHVIDNKNYMGSPPDGEAANQPSSDADADDLTGKDDEDGVTFPGLTQGQRVTIPVLITGLAYVNGWVDWNGDGDFADSGERIISNALRATGTSNFSFTVPATAITSRPTFARFRFGPSSNSSSGSAKYGEVEDYQVRILCIPLSPPAVGEVIQPDCEVKTGSVTLNGLPSSGTWILTRFPDEVTVTGTGSSTIVSGLEPGTYSFTVTNDKGCTSVPSAEVVIREFAGTPPPPTAETIIQPTCTLSTGTIRLTGLPGTGTWTLTRYPGGIVMTGTGISTTVSGLAPATYNFTVENSEGCISSLSADIIIISQPSTPTAPEPGTVTHPTCEVPTGSVILNGLPSSGTWTLTRFPGSVQTSGTGASTTVSGLGQGTYNFTVTNAEGCTSLVSPDVVINLQPGPAPSLKITNPSPVCYPSTADLTNPEIIRGSTPGLSYSYWTDAGANLPYGTPAQATEGTYYIMGTTISGCSDIKPVIVTVYQMPASFAGPDLILEYTFSTSLQADEPGNNNTGHWSVIKGSGMFADATDAKTTVNNLAVGENVLSWTVTNGICQPSTDFVSITVLDMLIPTLITPDMNGKNDYFIIKGIESLGKTSLIVCDRRGAVVYEDKDYKNLWSGFDYKGNPLPNDTYFFLLRPENGKSVRGYLVIRR